MQVPLFQQVINEQALQSEMIASQMQAAHATTIQPISGDSNSHHPATTGVIPTARFYNTLPNSSRSAFPPPTSKSNSAHSRNAPPPSGSEDNGGMETESEAETDDEGNNSELGEFPAFDKCQLKAKEQWLQDRKRGGTKPCTQRQRKHDNNLNRGLLADIDEKHWPLISNAIEIYTSLILDEDPLGLEPAKSRARIAMQQASAEDGTLHLKPN